MMDFYKTPQKEMLRTIHLVGVGMGPDDIGSSAAKLIAAADVLAGGGRVLGYFPQNAAEKILLAGPVDEWIGKISDAAREKRVVVLASGDPNFYGVADRLIKTVGPENVRIHPNVTAVQAAFARLKETWADVAVVSLHGRNEDALYDALVRNRRVAVYTDNVNTPSRIAQLLMDRGQTGWRMGVIENLGSADVRVSYYRLQEAVRAVFSPLNIVVLWLKDAPTPLTIGTPDDDYYHEAGMITKAEVRAVALARLSLGAGMVVWDLGAGCGSVGIESTLLTPGGKVFAVEKNEGRISRIKTNRSKFGVAALEVIHGEAPGVLDSLPDPDRVFIGGGGSDLGEIIESSGRRLNDGGVIVVSAVQLESIAIARRTLADLDFDFDMVQIQVSRSSPIGDDQYLKPLNPVCLIRGKKVK